MCIWVFFDLSGHIPAVWISGTNRTSITPAYLTKAFKEIRDLVNRYSDYIEKEPPAIH